MAHEKLRYDVCLSYAGEERTYVEQVAQALKVAGIRVFFDKYEVASLWGKDLSRHLQDIYKHYARLCVVFISKAYAAKPWPLHELKSAQARAVAEDAEYILPARFDDTQVPGISETVGYVDLRDTPPEILADLIAQKLGRVKRSLDTLRSSPPEPPEQRSATISDSRSQEPHQLPSEALDALPRQPRLKEIEAESQSQPEGELLIGLVHHGRGKLYTSPMTPQIDCVRCGRTISSKEPITRFGDGYAHWFDCLDDG